MSLITVRAGWTMPNGNVSRRIRRKWVRQDNVLFCSSINIPNRSGSLVLKVCSHRHIGSLIALRYWLEVRESFCLMFQMQPNFPTTSRRTERRMENISVMWCCSLVHCRLPLSPSELDQISICEIMLTNHFQLFVISGLHLSLRILHRLSAGPSFLQVKTSEISNEFKKT